MAIATLDDISLQMDRGKMVIQMGLSATTTTSTAGGSTSGQGSIAFGGNSIGSTWPGTVESFQQPAGLSSPCFNICNYMTNSGTARGSAFCRLYKVGTLNLTATGDQFTHDAATFPLKRTVYGASSTAVAYIPILILTTALTVTAAAFQLQTNAGGAGYVDQDGNNVVGTKTFTFPALNAALGSAYFLRLEDTDYAAQDITQIKVTTASTTGAADIYLMEIIAHTQNLVVAMSQYDAIVDSGLALKDQLPAVATSGTAVSKLVALSFTNSGFSSTILNIGVLG